MALQLSGQAVCDPQIETVRSPRLANYVMDLTFDPALRGVRGTQQITFINPSDSIIEHVDMYMYLNAFKNTKSSYLRYSARNVMGQDLSGRSDEEWGFVELTSVKSDATDQELKRYYVQDLDDNEDDQSVIRVELNRPLQAGDTLVLLTSFESKLPKTIARAGYAANDFNFFVHWYPKLGVYEQDEEGHWDWNCHQFLQRMEFYGEFGVYDVTIEAPSRFVIGGSGCRTTEDIAGENRRHHFIAADVIDFAWCAYPDFEVYEDNYKGIEIEMLSPGHHAELVPRLMGAVKNSLKFMEEHLGPYPYPKITLMDPPALGMRSGFMEYPTFITGGSFYGFPKGVKSLESLVAHEFAHQYFMAIVATNEKEAPWLDEGFVTFFEDEIMEAYYEEASLIDFMGYEVSNSAQSRIEYTGLRNKRSSHITQKSWLFPGDYKGIVYAKTATFFQSLKNWMDRDRFYEMMSGYFDSYQFTHPRRDDFLGYLFSYIDEHYDTLEAESMKAFCLTALDDTAVCDLSVTSIHHLDIPEQPDMVRSVVRVEQLQDFFIPVPVEFTFADGTVERLDWRGDEAIRDFTFERESPVVSAYVDPDQRIFLDIDLNNNSITLDPEQSGLLKYASRTTYWVQNIMNALSFLM